MPNQNNALSIQSLGDSKKQKLDICFFIVQNSFTWDMSCVKCALIFFCFTGNAMRYTLIYLA